MDILKTQRGSIVVDGRTVPIVAGEEARRFLVINYGLPNAYPEPGKLPFNARRLLFVDDDEGRPVALWVP